jgi:hypothetical protein
MPWYEPSTSEGHGAMTVVTRRRNGTLRLSTAGKLFRTFGPGFPVPRKLLPGSSSWWRRQHATSHPTPEVLER